MLPLPLVKVISGGQTGADRAGLRAAKKAGLATGGWMPRGFLALDGKHPEFADLYGIRAHTSSYYPPRTALNVKESDGTIRFATSWDSPGERLTLALCQRYGRPVIDVTPGNEIKPESVVDWIVTNSIRILNVAGNTERTAPGIEAQVFAFLNELFRILKMQFNSFCAADKC